MRKNNIKMISLLIITLLFIASPLAMGFNSDTQTQSTGDTLQIQQPTIPILWNYNGNNVNIHKIDQRILNITFMETFSRKYSSMLEKEYMLNYGVKTSQKPIGLFIKINNPSKLDKVKEIVKRLDGTPLKYYPQIKWLLAAFPADKASEAAARLSQMNEVSYITLDSVKKPQMYDVNALIGLPQLRENLGLNGTGVTVAILDTGVDPNVPGIPQPAYWKDFVNGSATPYDDVGHGTHVAGILLGRNMSLFPTGDYMWHAVLVGKSNIFNPPVENANLTYQVNVTSYAGENVTLSVSQLYILTEGYLNSYTYVKADASIEYNIIYVNGSASGWETLVALSGNQLTPTTDNYTISIPVNASSLQIEFNYTFFSQWNSSYVFVTSERDIIGWFINNITLYNSTNQSDIILTDQVANSTAPSQVINQTWWVRTQDEFQGIAPNATLAAAKVCSASGCTDSAILEGMNWSLSIGADIVSMSLGGRSYVYDPLAQMADYLVSQGVVVVVAAGNSGPTYLTIESPGISHKAITVAAATKEDTITRFSSSGPTHIDFYLKPDIAAIGYEVISTVSPSGSEAPSWASTLPLVSWSGTSMATPMVAGVAALLKQEHPSWTPDMIKSAIISTGDFLKNNTYMVESDNIFKQGGGLIDPHQALNTTILPIPANLFLGFRLIGVDMNASNVTTILNTGSQDVNLTVVSVKLFNITDIYSYNGVVANSTNLLEAPVVGENITVPAGQTANVTILVNLTDTANLTPGIYGGYVTFKINTTGEEIHVIFDFYLDNRVNLTGRVIDYSTGQPLEGVNVTAWYSSWGIQLGKPAASNITDANGNFTLKNVPASFGAIRFAVRITASLNGYISHLDYPKYYYNDANVGNLKLVKLPDRPTLLLVVDRDADWWNATYSSLINNSINIVENTSQEYGIPTLYWNASDPGMGCPYYALVGGYYPIIVFMAGGTYYPLYDYYDEQGFIYYTTVYPGFVFMTTGDLGWEYENSTILTKVAHAYYINDVIDNTSFNIYFYNKTLVNTLWGLDYYLSKLGTPSDEVIGEGLLNGVYDWYPDVVIPTPNATAVAYLNISISSSYPYNTTGTLYTGGGNENASTLFLGFELPQINETLQSNIIANIIAYMYTKHPTTLAGPVPAYIENGNITFAASTGYAPGLIIEYPLGFKLVVSNQSGILTTVESTSLPITLNLSSIGASPGDYIIGKLTAVDRLGTVVNATYEANYISAKKIVASVWPTNITFKVNIPPEVTVTLNTTNTTLVQLSSLSLASLPKPPSVVGWMVLIPIDVYMHESVNGSTSQIVLEVKAPKYTSHIEMAKLYWFNGSGWVEFNPVSIDNKTGTITIVINNSSTPSLSDLTGTPILLAIPPASVGGELVGSHATSMSMLAVVAVVGLVLVGVAYSRRKRLTN